MWLSIALAALFVILGILRIRGALQLGERAKIYYRARLEINQAWKTAIPKYQTILFYVALGVGLCGLLGVIFSLEYNIDDIATPSLLTLLVAVGYIGWFSLRWRHLR